MRIGYFLSCEEYSPSQLLEQARLAEDAGFEALWISDHFHPWNDEQGESAFVWSMIGAISQVCSLPVTTAVTCPTMRVNPVIVAQAAATSAVLLDGRFTLGIGTGEALNEHILGQVYPSTDVRLEMLEEAVEVMRKLWTGDVISHHGRYYTVDTARIYTLPDEPPPIYMSGFGPKAAGVAGRIADGYISTMPDGDLVETSRRPAARASRPRWASRSAMRTHPKRASRSPTDCGPTPAYPGSSRRCCRPRDTSSRPPSWSPRR